jgi:hypothetical protein
MGVSAAIAGGCNIGHTFTGVPTLALSSLLASVTIFIGTLLGNWLRYTILENPIPQCQQIDYTLARTSDIILARAVYAIYCVRLPYS